MAGAQRRPQLRSAKTCSTIAWSRCCASAWIISNGESVNRARYRQMADSSSWPPTALRFRSRTRRTISRAVMAPWAEFAFAAAQPGSCDHRRGQRRGGDRGQRRGGDRGQRVQAADHQALAPGFRAPGPAASLGVPVHAFCIESMSMNASTLASGSNSVPAARAPGNCRVTVSSCTCEVPSRPGSRKLKQLPLSQLRGRLPRRHARIQPYLRGGLRLRGR